MTSMSKKIRQEDAPVGSRSDTPIAQARAAFSMHGLRVTLIRMAVISGFLLLWQIASGPWIEPFLISSPSRILVSLVTGFRHGDLLQHTWVTFTEIAIGFPVGAIAGMVLGYAFGRSRVLAEIFEPIIVALNGIPRTAVAPLFIVWLGIGLWSKVGVVVLLTFFLNFFMTYTGMRQMDQEYIDLARLMRVKGWKLTWTVIFPAISPYLFTGIRTSIPFAVIGAIVGEFVASTEGVGFFIRMSAGIFKTADVFVGIIVLMIMVVVMDKIAARIEKRVLHWQTQTEPMHIQGEKQGDTAMEKQTQGAIGIIALTAFLLVSGRIPGASAQHKELPEVTLMTAVPNFAFGAIWVAEQLKYFEAEGVRVKVTPSPSGSICLNAVIGRSTHFCASTSEGLVLARLEGAPALAIQAHNRTLTLSVVLRKAIVDQLGLTRDSPIEARLKALTQLGTIGATGAGAVSEQIFRFLVAKSGGDPTKLKFVYIGAAELPASLMNNVIDAYALSPPSAEITEPSGKGYVLIPLGKGELPELTDYPYEVLMVRPDYLEANPTIATAVARAISRGGALFHTHPDAAKEALRSHRLYTKDKLAEDVFELSYAMVARAMPAWGTMSVEGWQKVLNFAAGAGMLKEPAKAPSAQEGVLWTNKYVGQAP